MSRFGLDRVFQPDSVVIVGGSHRPSSIGALVLQNLESGGFAGRIAVVNPKYQAIDGRKSFRDVQSLPFVPDLIVVTAPAPSIPGIIEQAGQRGGAGPGGISCPTWHHVRSLAEPTANAARAHKMRILGPNSLGMMFPGVGLNASFAARHPSSGSLA